jgi:hypothetical protein
MPFGEFFCEDELLTPVPSSPSAPLYRIVDVHRATDIDKIVIRKKNSEVLTLWRILASDVEVGDKVMWRDGTSLSLSEVVEADGQAHKTDRGTWVYHFRLKGELRPRQITPGDRVTILPRQDES